jgi:predicted O-methyltransferase YrrM
MLARLMAPGYRDIEDLVPSPKAEHIPFLFALADILRPRRVVEIGTLRGAGFLALCQAARQGGFPTEAVAVSGWSVGQKQAAEYRGAFETFSFLIRKYADFAGYLRLRHEDAVLRFEDGSIDLLHLDGFCEELPLRQALDLWRPKLSARGVLLMHDTNVHGGAFGVWRVWEDLVAAHPAFEFPHAEGLGLACLGAEAPGEIVELCEAARTDRHLRLLLRQHFECQGRLASELFSRRYDMAQSEARARAEGGQAEELSWLRQETETLRADNAQLRELLKGSISHGFTG